MSTQPLFDAVCRKYFQFSMASGRISCLYYVDSLPPFEMEEFLIFLRKSCPRNISRCVPKWLCRFDSNFSQVNAIILRMLLRAKVINYVDITLTDETSGAVFSFVNSSSSVLKRHSQLEVGNVVLIEECGEVKKKRVRGTWLIDLLARSFMYPNQKRYFTLFAEVEHLIGA